MERDSRRRGVCCAVECGLKRVLPFLIDKAAIDAHLRSGRGGAIILCPSSADYHGLGWRWCDDGGGSFVPDINRPNITSEQSANYPNWVAHLSLYLLPAVLFCFATA